MKLPILYIVLFPALLCAQPDPVKEVCLTNAPGDDRYASYSPDGSNIIFESNRDGNWEIYLMDANGENQERLTTHKGNDRRPGWHPDGKRILFESNRDGKMELYTMRLKNKRVKKISQHHYPGTLIFASFSPDGKSIAASLSASDDKSAIVLLNKKGKIVKRLTPADTRSYYPRWSPDGEEIVFFSRKDTDNRDDELYKIHLESGKETRLTHWPKHNFCPSWSNDKKHIVYVTSMEGTRPEIYIMSSDGKNQKRITVNEDGDTLPNWAPDKDRILITAYRNGNFEICELELNVEEE